MYFLSTLPYSERIIIQRIFQGFGYVHSFYTGRSKVPPGGGGTFWTVYSTAVVNCKQPNSCSSFASPNKARDHPAPAELPDHISPLARHKLTQPIAETLSLRSLDPPLFLRSDLGQWTRRLRSLLLQVDPHSIERRIRFLDIIRTT